MPKEDVLQQQQKVEEQHMPGQELLDNQEQDALLQDFLADEQQLDFERKLQEQKEFLATSRDVENLRALNTYMANRSQQTWAQNYDEYAELAGQLNQKFQTQYQYETQHSNWAELEQQARDTLAHVMERDEEQQKVKQNTSFAGIEETVDAILKDRNIFTDSGMYREIRSICEKYKAENGSLKKRLTILEELQGKVRTYTELRYKKDGYGTKKGARRMGWMTKLLAMISGVQGSMLPGIADLAEEMKENAERRSRTKADLEQYHQDKLDAFKKGGTKIPMGRTADFLLYYERDKKGQVTEETRANYEENMKMLDAFSDGEFTRENQEKRIGAIGKIYKRLKKFQIDENSLTLEKVKECLQARVSTDGFSIVYNLFNDLVTDERDRYLERNLPVDERITYMIEQTSSLVQTYFAIMTETMLVRLGLTTSGALKSDQDKKKINAMGDELQGELDMYMGLCREELQKGNAVPLPDAAMEELLGDAVAYYENPQAVELSKTDLHDPMAYYDTKYMKSLSEDPEYMANLSKQVAESRQKYEKSLDFVKQDLGSKYGDYFSANGLKKLGIPNYYPKATEPKRIWSALDPYEKDAEGNVTPETMAGYKQNERIMELLFSPNAEDRIAVMAKMYLRLGKFYTDGMPLTESTILLAYKREADSNTLCSTRNILDDMLASELERDANNPLVKYMKQMEMSKVETGVAYVGEYIQGSQGYTVDGVPFEGTEAERENFKMVQRMTKEGIMEGLKGDIEAEKKENRGHIMMKNLVMEDSLKELCRKKGLNFD